MSFNKRTNETELDQCELSARLLSLTVNNNYTLTQVNGQRIFKKAPHIWTGPEPSRNCEVFIGRVPHDCFEDVLVPLFREAGDIYEFRLMINFSGWNRGYAFAMYTTQEAAANAIRMFNNYAIRPSWLLGVCQSINNCRIYVSKIPAGTSSEDVVRLVYSLTEEVREVRVRRTGGGVCAAIVEYKSHRGAAMARKALVAAAASYGGHLDVDWSLPQSPQLMKQYREVGRWTPEHGIEIWQAEDITPLTEERLVRASAFTPAHVPHVPHVPEVPSYGLEPWSLARRNRMIEEAARATANNVAQMALCDEPRGQTTTKRENGHYDLMMEVALSNEPLHPHQHSKMFANLQDRVNVDFTIGLAQAGGDSCQPKRLPTLEQMGVYAASPEPVNFEISGLRQWTVAKVEVLSPETGVRGSGAGVGGAGTDMGAGGDAGPRSGTGIGCAGADIESVRAGIESLRAGIESVRAGFGGAWAGIGGVRAGSPGAGVVIRRAEADIGRAGSGTEKKKMNIGSAAVGMGDAWAGIGLPATGMGRAGVLIGDAASAYGDTVAARATQYNPWTIRLPNM